MRATSVAPPEVIAAASEALATNCEIDELQSAACRAIAKATGAEAGCVTGASARNWASYAPEVRLAPQLEGAYQALLCDPQTSGGLLIACAHEVAPEVIRILQRHGCAHAAAIGAISGDAPLVRVEP